MGLSQTHFPEHDLTLRIYAGKVTADEVIRSYKEQDAATGSRWLTFVDLAGETPQGIIGDIPVGRFPEIKRTLAAKTRSLFGDRRVSAAVVCSAEAFDEIAGFWRAYAVAGEEAPIDAAFFTSVEEACAWLELTDAACAAVTRAIEAHGAGARRAEAAAGSSRRWRDGEAVGGSDR
jgi:hypothetical protein